MTDHRPAEASVVALGWTPRNCLAWVGALFARGDPRADALANRIWQDLNNQGDDAAQIVTLRLTSRDLALLNDRDA